MNDANPPAAELGITAKDVGRQSASEGIEKLFGQSFEIKKLEYGKPIPVGGDSIFSDKLDKRFTCDFDHFNSLFQEMHNAIETYDSDGLIKWLKTQDLLISPKIVATLTAFARKLKEKYPTTSEGENVIKNMYADVGKEVKISEVFEGHNAACAEISALAQYFLQSEGVDSSFFSGEVLWNKDYEFAGKHSFIVIRDKDIQYLFDPANPTRAQDGIYPSVYALRADFNEEVRKDQKRFVTGTNILTKQNAYYGVGNGTNISSENIAA